MEQQCSQCKILKPIEAFHYYNSKINRRRKNCKDCQRQVIRFHYAKNKQRYVDNKNRYREKCRQYVLDLKNNTPCTDCGKQYPYYVMDFDHLEPENKLNKISALMKDSLELIKEEIKKCEIVCANCHRIRTFNRGDTLNYGS